MKRIFALFLIISHLSGMAQIKDVGLYYSVNHAKSVVVDKSNNVGFQINFSSKNKFSIQSFAFYARNNFSPNINYTIKVPFSPQTVNIFDGEELVTSFSGTQFGLGASVYYELFKKEKFVMLSGIGASVSFFTKAEAVYGTRYVETDTLQGWHFYGIKENTRNTNNHNNLRDAALDILLINLNIKCQYSITKQLSIFTEPFVSLFRVYKTNSSILPSIGANFGLTWKIKRLPKPN